MAAASFWCRHGHTFHTRDRDRRVVLNHPEPRRPRYGVTEVISWNVDAGQLVAHIVPSTTVWREASGEGPQGMLAVAMVIHNRVLKRRLTVEQVCLQRWQFSSMNAPNDPGMLRWPQADDQSFRQAYTIWLASAAIKPEDDPTKGADFYFADGIPMPQWAKAYTFTVTIGKQHFYRS